MAGWDVMQGRGFLPLPLLPPYWNGTIGKRPNDPFLSRVVAGNRPYPVQQKGRIEIFTAKLT